jgi:hypothetical protein
MTHTTREPSPPPRLQPQSSLHPVENPAEKPAEKPTEKYDAPISIKKKVELVPREHAPARGANDPQPPPGATIQGRRLDRDREDQECQLAIFIQLAWKHGWRHGHLSLLFRDFRREYYQQGGQQDQAQTPVVSSEGQVTERRENCDTSVRPSEEEIALGLGIMSLWVLFAICLGGYALDVEEKKGEAPRRYDWIAVKLAGWSAWCAVWVGMKCLSLVWGSWWKGRVEPGKGIEAFALVGFVLATVLEIVADGILIFQRRSPVAAMAPTWIFRAIVGRGDGGLGCMVRTEPAQVVVTKPGQQFLTCGLELSVSGLFFETISLILPHLPGQQLFVPCALPMRPSQLILGCLNRAPTWPHFTATLASSTAIACQGVSTKLGFLSHVGRRVCEPGVAAQAHTQWTR